MAEEKKEKKKSGIVKRIFKWFGLGLLTVLIILGLIFQAPWKVTTLLLIILLACTILPKPARKWFWLSVGVVVIALVVWAFLPDDTEGWRPYTFDEELADLKAKYAIPDEENAAIIYSLLLEIDEEEDESEPNFLSNGCYDITGTEPWLSEDHPEIAQWLKGQESKIETLLEASKVEKCQFPISANSADLTNPLERLSAMRRWAYLLKRTSNNDIAEGRINEALEKSITILQMAKHLYQQPTNLDMVVGIAIEAFALRQFNRFIVIGDATQIHLSVIEEALAEIKHDWNSDLPRILECEKLFAKNFWGMFYGVSPEGRIRLNPGVAMRAIMAQLPEDMKDELVITYWHKRVIKVWTILGWFFMPSTPQKAGEIIDESFEKYYAMTDPNFDWEKGPREFSMTSIRFNYRYMVEMLVNILEPAYYRIYDIYLRVTADKRGSRIIIALRQYKNQNGFWPVNLDDVKSMAPAEIFVDPTNGGDFVYEITQENFRLYSKGKNDIDEDGERDEIAGADDWLIWPPRSRKAKEEGTDAEQQ